MTDVLLILVTLAAFVFGFFVIRKVDVYLEENDRLAASGERISGPCVRIAAENPAYFDAVASALACASDSNPYLDFRFSSAHRNRLLHQISNGDIDIALLLKENTKELDEGLGCAEISDFPQGKAATKLGLNVELTDAKGRLIVVWNKAIASKDRDRVLFVLENSIQAEIH